MEAVGLAIIISGVIGLLAEPLVIPLVFGRATATPVRVQAQPLRGRHPGRGWRYEPPQR